VLAHFVGQAVMKKAHLFRRKIVKVQCKELASMLEFLVHIMKFCCRLQVIWNPQYLYIMVIGFPVLTGHLEQMLHLGVK
jgi:hypothetical protein